MRCIHCGNAVKASNAACQHCGARVVRPSVEASAGRRSIGGATVLLLLLGAGVAIWFARDRLPFTMTTRDFTFEAPVTSPAQPPAPNPSPPPPSSPVQPAAKPPASEQPSRPVTVSSTATPTASPDTSKPAPLSRADTEPPRGASAKETAQVPRGRSAPAATLPTTPPRSTKAVRVGGNIAAPKKLKDVAPVYPQMAVQARLQGVVIIEATIGTDGAVTNARVLRPVQQMLDEAALEAVRQWEYAPTLLNGIAVPVIITVTVNFALK